MKWIGLLYISNLISVWTYCFCTHGVDFGMPFIYTTIRQFQGFCFLNFFFLFKKNLLLLDVLYVPLLPITSLFFFFSFCVLGMYEMILFSFFSNFIGVVLLLSFLLIIFYVMSLSGNIWRNFYLINTYMILCFKFLLVLYWVTKLNDICLVRG